MKFVAVTACPSGVAHTFMAAQGLKDGGAKYGVEVRVETQGSLGVGDELTADEIAEADAVILTNDIGIKGEERFAGKPIVRVKTDMCIAKGGAIVKTLIDKLSK